MSFSIISTHRNRGITIKTKKQWLRYRFEKDNYDTDLLLAYIEDLPTLGLSETDKYIDAYFHFENAVETDREIQNILNSLALVNIRYQRDVIVNENWHLNWQKYFTPVSISPDFVVFPYWLKYRGREKVKIAIKPGMAFGTGTHPTTQMALRLMEKYVNPGMTVLDAGCGSGILTIAALKLGAEFVSAWDIDPDVADNFHENLELNNMPQRFSLTIGDITKHDSCAVDFILSNIERKANIALLENIRMYGKIPPGIFTGILKDEYALFKAKVLNYGLMCKEELFQQEWAAVVVTPDEK
jgi:ribosomal protein L11 methyltransferase